MCANAGPVEGGGAQVGGTKTGVAAGPPPCAVVSGSRRGRRKRGGGPATRFLGGCGGRDPLGVHVTASLAIRRWRQPAAGAGVSDRRSAPRTRSSRLGDLGGPVLRFIRPRRRPHHPPPGCRPLP